jgi:hypothetical protein
LIFFAFSGKERQEYWSQVESDKADALMLCFSVSDCKNFLFFLAIIMCILDETFSGWLPEHFGYAEKSQNQKPRKVVLVGTKSHLKVIYSFC